MASMDFSVEKSRNICYDMKNIQWNQEAYMENRITLKHGQLEIPCKINVPDYGEIRRVVLSVHGLGGCMEDEIQVGIAEEMELFYSATVRFDFPCHGESPADNNVLMLQPCREALMAAARYAKEAFPEVNDLCIFATGFGAYMTLLCLEELLELPGKVKLVVQTPSVRMHETILAMKRINRETLWAMDSVTFRTPRPFELTYKFYEELAENIVFTTHPIPMLILHGEEDQFIRNSDIQQFNRINETSKLVIIPGTSHRFLEDGAWDMVLDLTRDWFEFEQVLLTDWQ